MASPTHVNQASTSASFGATRVLVMPTSPAPVTGQLLLAFVSGESALTTDTMSGWTKIGTANNGGGEYLSTYKRISDGADSGTVGGGGNATRQAWVTTADSWDGVLANVGYVAATTNTMDAPSLSMGASRDHLFYGFARNNNNNITAAPTNYTFVATPITGGVVRLAVAYRETTGTTSENPGAFTGTVSAAVSGVIGVRPATFVNHVGAAALSADSTLTAAGARVQPAAAALSADTTLTSAGAPIRPAAASLAADTTLTAAGVREHPGAAALSADTTLTSAGTLLAPGADLFATSTLTATAVAIRTGATVDMVAETTLTVDTTSELTATADLAATSTLTADATRVHQASVSLTAEADLLAGTASLRLASAALAATSSLTATAFIPTAKPIEFFDMAVTITPPNGHFKPMPLLLGANWQPNDIRILMVSAYGAGQGGVHQPLPMDPPLPPGWTAAYDLSSGQETKGVFWRRLQAGDQSTSVAWAKPPSWGNFLFVTLTARGVDPTSVLTAGAFSVAHQNGDTIATTSPVTVPAPGSMLLCVATIPDPGSSSSPSWATAMGVPGGWTPMVATDNSGANFDEFNADPNALVIGKSFPASGSTGAVPIPIAIGRPAFISMHVFLRPAGDTTISVGAA